MASLDTSKVQILLHMMVSPQNFALSQCLVYLGSYCELTTTASIPCPEGNKMQQPTEQNAFNHIVPVGHKIQQWT